MLSYSDVKLDSIGRYKNELLKCPKYGLHNPLHNVERYRTYGQVCAAAASVLTDPAVAHFFARLIQRVITLYENLLST
jgi:1-pyrroline-5-carboxylate dehydrogenase